MLIRTDWRSDPRDRWRPSSPRTPAACGSPARASLRTSPSQASAAQMAPPDVPLSATTSTSAGRLPSRPWRTPAVNAVWLPPPWQAIATRFFDPSLIGRAPFQHAWDCSELERSASQRVASGQKVFCALPPTTSPTCPASIIIDLTSRAPDVGPDALRRRRGDQVIVLGRQQQQRAGDPAEVDAPVAEAELAPHQLVVLVQLLHELAERLAGDRDVVVDPALHREVVGR